MISRILKPFIQYVFSIKKVLDLKDQVCVIGICIGVMFSVLLKTLKKMVCLISMPLFAAQHSYNCCKQKGFCLIYRTHIIIN